MRQNSVLYFEQEIESDWSNERIEQLVSVVMDEVISVYSLLVFADAENISKYTIRYGISEIESYNTIKKSQVIEKVLSSIRVDIRKSGKYVVGHIQPSLELMVNLYEPLVHKLATKQHRCWQQIEYEDLCQICRMTLVLLYNKGYYIHKRLLEKAFNNAVLMEMRKISSEVKFISLETRENGDEDMEKLCLIDTICDVDLENEKQDAESAETSMQIFAEVKDMLVDIIGERQFEQLFRDYANGHTSTWSRRKMQTIKVLFEKEGLTRQKFNNKYGR